MKRWDVYKDPKWLMDNLLRKYKVLRIPTNTSWGTNNAGSGAVTQAPFYIQVQTGTTALSRGLASTQVHGLNPGNAAWYMIDWTKRLELHMNIERTNSDAQCVARIQLKESNAEGALAQRGIGIEIDNYAMVGEGYGTSRGTVSLGNLTDGMPKRIKIVKTSSELRFWVNDVLTGTLTGDSVPNTLATTFTYLVISIVNGSTGGVNAYMAVGNICIIQEV
jgi:hypothetical protein